MKRIIFFISIIVFASMNLTAQEDITIGKIFTIKSEILNEEREILISLPNGYEENKKISYPVIYLLDGSSHFRYTSGIIKFLSEIRKTPQIIVVGVRNVDRMRDFTTPLKSSASNDSHEHHIISSNGGAYNFLSFLENELKVFIDENFRIDEFDILAGHSISGFFVIHCMVNNPELFDAYIAASPALWWNDEELLNLASDRFNNGERYDVKLYMAYGGIDGARIAPSCINFVKLLRKSAPARLKWKTDCLPNEIHRSTPLKSIYNGLEFFFIDWKVAPANTIKENTYKY